MWAIFEKKSVVKQRLKAPKEVIIRYEAWKRIIELEGPSGLKVIKGYHDESLQGEWKGFRASRLGIQWRVIYVISGEVCEVFVFEITPHKY